jgi:hypothetical protein
MAVICGMDNDYRSIHSRNCGGDMTEREIKSNRTWREEVESLRQQLDLVQNRMDWEADRAAQLDVALEDTRQQLAEQKEINGRLRQEKVNARVYFEQQLAECQATSTPNIPEGWQLVPKEPTKAMEESGAKAFLENHNWHAIYKGMLSGAPEYKAIANDSVKRQWQREALLEASKIGAIDAKELRRMAKELE